MQEITLWDTGRKNDETTLADNSSVPVEYETADGFMSSFLLASDRDKCDGGVNLLASRTRSRVLCVFRVGTLQRN